MVLRKLLPDIADWRITILATDVNPRFLKKAALGHYGQWSFRGVPASVREENFHQVQEGTWEIALAIRKMVSFSALNLAEDTYPSLVNDTNAMDVIFCRNVLIYFSREHAAKVASKMYQSLLEGGWLFTSPPEVSGDVFSRFATVREPGIIALRKQTQPVARATDRPPAPRPAPASRAPSRAVAVEAPAAEKIGPRADLALARKLANEGRLSEALLECDKAIAEDRLLAASHYLRGVILQEKAAFEPAREALRRALFLDPDLVVAHFALGNLLRRQDRWKDAAKSFENARALLQKYPPAAELPESDGVTAGRLLSIVESVQDIRV
jgi:chemotaxis protein methyltransferase CheR